MQYYQSENVCFAGPLWHVVRVAPRPRAELRAAKDIDKALGFTVFVPIELAWCTVRGVRVIGRKPLFPGYAFVAVDPYRQDWQRLLDIDGVVDVLGRPRGDERGLPSWVPTKHIDELRHAERVGVFDRTKPEPDGFAIGESVRVATGPFNGLRAEIISFNARMKSATAKKRAKILLEFFGRLMSVEVDVMRLEKLA